MDPFTHAALGVAAAIAVAGKNVNPRHAALAGLAAGLLPDADIFFRQEDDPLALFRWHRHFTHSLAFTPVVAVLGAAMARLALFRRGTRFRDLLIPAWAAGVVHVLNDAGTSYGTMLYLPFTRDRVAWDNLPIVDPVMLTIPLLILAILAVKRRSRTCALIALAWMVGYGALGAFQRERALDALHAFAKERGDKVERATVKPSPLSLILWRGVYEHDGVIRAVAIRPGVQSTKLWPGESTPALAAEDSRRPAPDSPAGRIVAELEHFTGGWMTATTLDSGEVLIGDARYSMLPQGVTPMWGVVLKPGDNDTIPRAHIERRDGDTPYRTFFGMILDNDNAPAWGIIR